MSITREVVLSEIKAIPNNNKLLELPTSFGKSSIAIELAKIYKAEKILIVVPRNVLKQNWKDELNKWYPDFKGTYTFTTYVSLYKYADNWDYIIFDEVHHLTERCREALGSFTYKYATLLSATVSRDTRYILKDTFTNLYCYKVSMRQATEEVLQHPMVYLYPLTLDNIKATEYIEYNKKVKTPPVEISWAQKGLAMKDKTRRYRVLCTQAQWYYNQSNLIDWYKRKFMGTRTEIIKNKWLRLASERLKWLSDKRTSITKQCIKLCMTKGARSLTFANDIEHSIVLGLNAIHSKNPYSTTVLDNFNHGEINHIVAVNCLNEGVNLVNCQVGIFGVINASETMTCQKVGRILRHKKPIIIIPYYKNTREEELVNKMIADYDKSYVVKITSLNEIKL
jgi:superfamily II DNA or RNA helicase